MAITNEELNSIIKLALEAISQVAAERGVSALQVLKDSNAIDDATLAHALAFQAELNALP